MIDELLDVTQLDSRRLVLVRSEIDPVRSVREICERMGLANEGRPISVREAGVPRKIWADPGRFDQVLSNLISNAGKYGAPATEIQIEIEGRADEVEVSVTNWGKGIPSDELPKLFQRFMRSTSSRASKTEGIGLGLYICKGLVEAHGGRIRVESTPQESTTFHVTWPVRAPAVSS
jgi:signal transduction histidine kinase